MGGGMEFPRNCQASVQSLRKENPQGNPWATANSVGCRTLGPWGESAKKPCQPLSEAAKVSAAQPYDLRMVGSTEAPVSTLVYSRQGQEFLRYSPGE